MQYNVINLLANAVSGKFIGLFFGCAGGFLVILCIVCLIAKKKAKAYEASLKEEEPAKEETPAEEEPAAEEEKAEEPETTEEAPVEEETTEEAEATEETPVEEEKAEEPTAEEETTEEPAAEEEPVEETPAEEEKAEEPAEEEAATEEPVEEEKKTEEAPVEEATEEASKPAPAVKADEKESYDDEEDKEHTVKGKYLIVSEGPNYRYKLKASNGEVIIVSEPYTSEKAVRTGIETLKKNLDKSHCDVVEDKHGLFSFRIMTGQGRCLATSANYSTKASATNAIESYKRWALSENIVVDDSEDKDHQEVEVLDFEIEQENNGTYVIKEEGEGFVYQLIAANKRVIATSLVYQSKASCKEALEKFRVAVYEGTFYLFKDKNDKCQFKLYNKQKRLVLAGEVYDSKQAVVSVVEAIKRLAKLAILEEAE